MFEIVGEDWRDHDCVDPSRGLRLRFLRGTRESRGWWLLDTPQRRIPFCAYDRIEQSASGEMHRNFDVVAFPDFSPFGLRGLIDEVGEFEFGTAEAQLDAALIAAEGLLVHSHDFHGLDKPEGFVRVSLSAIGGPEGLTLASFGYRGVDA